MHVIPGWQSFLYSMVTRTCRTLPVLFLLVMSLPLHAQAIVFDNGLVNEFNSGTFQDAFVGNSAMGDPTTVNVSGTATITRRLTSGQDSVVNIVGGSIQDVWMTGNSSLTISSATISNVVVALDQSNVEVFSGQINDNLVSINNATIIVHDILGETIQAENNGVTTILGGSFLNAVADGRTPGDPTLNLRGGTPLQGVLSFGTGTVNIYGLSFDRPFGTIIDLSGSLSGILEDGTTLVGMPFTRETGAVINLIEIPEPSTLLLLAAGGVAVLRKREGRVVRLQGAEPSAEFPSPEYPS